MILIIPLGYAANVDDIPGHTHFLYYNDIEGDSESLTAYVISIEPRAKCNT